MAKDSTSSGGGLGGFLKHIRLNLRAKLIAIFLTVKIIPLLLIVIIAWQQIGYLGEDLLSIAVNDSTFMLNDAAVESVERLSTDTAKRVADFLYERDDDIRYIAGLASALGGDEDNMELAFSQYVRSQFRRIVAPSEWVLGTDDNGGQIWVSTADADMSDTLGESTNKTNEDVRNGSGFSPREADYLQYENAPLYDEITFIGLDGLEKIKISTTDLPTSRKNRYADSFITGDLKDVSLKRNTFIGAEVYWDGLSALTDVRGGDIYVSDVIGAYTPSNYAGMYTPDAVAAAAAARGYDIPYEPEAQSYAGAENPNGVRFEGIVRWVSPVYVDGAKIGYVSLALDHDHIMELVDHITPMNDRTTELPSAYEGNYAFLWDYQCRSIVHPRHNSIVGYDDATGEEAIPWVSETIYRTLLAEEGVDSFEYGRMTQADRLALFRVSWTKHLNGSEDGKPVYDLIRGIQTFDNQDRPNQTLSSDPDHTPAADLTRAGQIGLDGRYLNNAPQCTGWLDLAGRGGSGSLYILWSGIYKLNTAAAIPYYTGQYADHYAPGTGRHEDWNRVGFGFVAIGSSIDDFTEPARQMGDNLNRALDSNLRSTSARLSFTTALLIILVVFIAIWVASFLTNNIRYIITGMEKFRRGERQFRFFSTQRDEFGTLADSFDEMADSIVESVHSPLIIADMQRKIIYMNDLGLSLQKRTLSEVTGTDYSSHSVYPSGSEYDPIDALHGGRESEVIFSPDSQRFFKGVASYLTDRDGEKIGYIVVSNDVTEMSLKQQQLEEAVESANIANEHKGEFLARMSHEIRTPMNAIIGLSSLIGMKVSGLPGDDMKMIRENIKKIDSSSQHLLGLINDILDISRIEAGKIEINEETVDLSALIDVVNNVIRPRCEDKRISYVTETEPFDKSSFTSDGLRLRQVLINILGNAAKFTPEGGTVTFRAARLDRKDGKSLIEFVCRDTGIGISDENLGKIFSPFEQGGANVTRKFGGTGLGLSISRRIIQLLGSEIEVSSKLGEGSEFRFKLWLPEVERETPMLSSDEIDIRGKFAGKRMLLVDDVEINRVIVAALLEDSGIEIEEAADGLPAVELFAHSAPGHFDVVLMDVQMPNMNGYEATRAIRGLPRADAKNVPIVALTANAFADDIQRAKESGMNAHLAKPVETDTLMRLMLNILLKDG
ncbi:MAG: response regulator [Oscillospiraceae bacterium]|jgi:signal transduction histidine kinase/CheY-like chemotaxis protein|nr:response regulator [Oscillospiraceae bacterium]